MIVEPQTLPASAAAPEVPVQSILCVDDEANILSALRRLLRPYGWRLVTAESPLLAMELLVDDSFDLIISDMRMPEMDGAHFLEQARSLQPDAIRILLTGQADINSTIEAINRGAIYRFIGKPWDDQLFVFEVRRALERRALEIDKARLEQTAHHQNEQLRQANQSLEQRVQERTAELEQASAALSAAHERLRGDFVHSVKLLASLIEMRDRSLTGHSRRVAEVARKIADALGADRGMTQDLVYAALLQDIGKIGWRDQLLRTPEELITGPDLAETRVHPVKGEAAMMGLAGLRGAAAMVRSHRERFDGSGYPDALAGEEIPLGARILAVAKDFDALQVGTLIDQRLSPGEALRFIEDGEGIRYDPKVAAVLRTSVAIAPDQADEQVECAPLESALSPHELRSGMTLSRDLVSPEGFLLLAAEERLSARHIEHLVAYAGVEGQPVLVWVHPEH